MNNLILENVRIGFRNFSGKAGRYNQEGDRNFVIFLSDADADRLYEQGWNIKQTKPKNPDQEPDKYLPVSVSFNGRPPRVVLITSRGKTELTEEEVSILDWAIIKNADVAIRPYEWEVQGNHGVKAYLKSLFVTIEEDELDRKYGDIPDTAQNAMFPTVSEEASF